MANVDPTDFARRLARLDDMRVVDRAVALIWLHGRIDPALGVTAADLARELHAAGFAHPNVSRLNEDLRRDGRVRRALLGGFRIDAAAQHDLDEEFGPLVGPTPPPASDSVVPAELVAGTRGYLEKVVYQINASYDQTLYDCCAVMCRRLLETLIIEAYEKLGHANDIKDSDGNYRMFSGLLAQVERDNASLLHLGRGTMKALRDFKGLGDKSAHNRRFNATRADIDPLRADIRAATEDLLHVAGLK